MTLVNARIIRQFDQSDPDEEGTTLIAYETLDVDMTEGATLANMQAIVGGNVDCFDIAHPVTGSIATVWFHDDGKMIDLPRNYLAGFIAQAGGWQGPAWGDWIAGPVVVTGFDPKSGVTTTLPEEWGRLIDAVTPESE